MKTILTLMIATSLSFGNFFKEEDKQMHMAITTMASVCGGLIA